jgi:microcystin-dependent protein
MEPFLGQIMPVGFNFAPRGWATCSGQLLAISQNTALFSLLGTTFGGDGRTTFGLPDLRGRSMVGVGSGPGLETRRWGQRGGGNTVGLTVSNLPNHTHTLVGVAAVGTERIPTGLALAGNTGGDIYSTSTPNAPMKSGSIANTGGSIPFDIDNPYLGLYINIALVGIFPSRS